MLARGDQVRLPHGRGVGIVIDCDRSECLVFVGTRPGGVPVVENYVECELHYTGKHFGKVGREIALRVHRGDCVRAGAVLVG